MNMVISSAPSAAGKALATAAGTAQGTSAEGGNGFAGALVQAIDGGNASSSTGGSLSLPVGIVGLLGSAGATSGQGQTEDLLAMLSNLAEQLGQLEQSEAQLSPEMEEQLAAMLALLQNLLGQLRQDQPARDTALTEAPETPVMANLATNAQPSNPLVHSLRDVVRQLTEAVASGKDLPEQLSSISGQVKAAFDTLTSIAASLATNGTKAGETDRAKSAGKAENDPTSAGAVSKEALSQTASSADTRRPVQALRDPAWRHQVAANSESAATDVQATASSANESVESVATETRQVWTLLQNDRLANAESAAAKAPAPTPVPVQQFAEQMGKFLVKQFQLTQGNGISEAKLTLTPEHLGQVDVRIVMNNGTLTAHFIADNPAAKELLENQMAQLRTSLQGQGLQVERLEVVQQSHSSSGTTFQHQEHRNSQSGREGSGGQNGDEGTEDSAAFAAELERNSSLKEIGYGGSINVTA